MPICKKFLGIFPKARFVIPSDSNEALGRLIAAVDWEAIYIANEASDEEVRRRANILIDCAREAREVYLANGGSEQD
jgi:hypothetical protein